MTRKKRKIKTWKCEPNEIARRFEINNIKRFFRRHWITIDPGTKALFSQDGMADIELPAGTYKNYPDFDKLLGADNAKKVTVVLLNVDDIPLKFHIEYLLTNESVLVDMRCSVILQQKKTRESNIYFVHLMKSKKLLEICDMEELLKDKMKNTVQAKIKTYSVNELYGNLEFEVELEQEFKQQMKTTFERMGLKLVQVLSINFLFSADVEESVKEISAGAILPPLPTLEQSSITEEKKILEELLGRVKLRRQGEKLQ